ncbi:MAG: Asp/Glu racemase [Kiloniellales bacterium]
MAAPAALLGQAARLEPRPARWRLGLIALATDHTTERDFAALCPSDDLAVYVNRVAFANPATPENLLALRPLLANAAELILPGETLEAIAFSCTSASALIGDAAVRDAIQSAKPGVPVVTPTSASIAAFATLQARRISLLAPYSKAVTEALAGYFEAGGLEILNASCFGLLDDREIARVLPDFIVAAAGEACHPRAEALFISCTALRAAPVAQAIEDRLGIPVVTSNQAMFWRAMRQAGCALSVSGFGRLLRSY